MLDQRFTALNMRKIVTTKDFLKDQKIQNLADLIPVLENLEKDIAGKNFEFPLFKKTEKKGHTVYIVPDHYSDFAIRKLNDNLRRIFRVAQADRSKLVSIVITLLSEQVPYYLIKSDISEFFKSIEREELVKQIERHALVSSDSKYVFNKLFSETNLALETGVPRGISISSTLSELYLRKFDADIKRIDSVYFFGRFVDDFIIFCFATPKQTFENISEALPKGLFINNQKTKIMQYRFPSTKHDQVAFDFLGYRFDKRGKKLAISIAPKKVKKIKTRLMRSFWSHAKREDFILLQDRIKFLTSNYILPPRRDSQAPIKAGIFFSYPLAADARETLIDLDKFLKVQINSPNSISRDMGVNLRRGERSVLNRYSFRSGFEERIVHKIPWRRIAEIRKCWEYG